MKQSQVYLICGLILLIFGVTGFSIFVLTFADFQHYDEGNWILSQNEKKKGESQWSEKLFQELTLNQSWPSIVHWLSIEWERKAATWNTRIGWTSCSMVSKLSWGNFPMNSTKCLSIGPTTMIHSRVQMANTSWSRCAWLFIWPTASIWASLSRTVGSIWTLWSRSNVRLYKYSSMHLLRI